MNNRFWRRILIEWSTPLTIFFIVLAAWGAYTEHTVRRIKELETQGQKAEQSLAAQMSLLTEANRKVQLLENLRHSEISHWNAEFNRELEAFAAETYLFRLQSRNRMGA